MKALLVLLLLLAPCFAASTGYATSQELVSITLYIDYGNGTRLEYNLLLPNGSTLFNATLEVAEVNYTVYDYGVFVNAINEVWNNPENNTYWMWYYWNVESAEWTLGPCSCDRYVVKDGELLIWAYQDVSSSEFPTPPEFELLVFVKDLETGEPIDNATVEVYDLEGTLVASFRTNSSGYANKTLLGGKYSLLVKAVGYLENSTSVVLGADLVVEVELAKPSSSPPSSVAAEVVLLAPALACVTLKLGRRRRGLN